MEETELLAAAREAFETAYTPYSEYPVGAALEAVDGTVYTGCNVENANYSNSLHAEEVAVGAAISDGKDEFERLAVASAAADNVTPCGMCRQTLAEFCGDAFEILCGTPAEFERHTLGELLPETITRAHLDTAEGER
ncbi:cytidine deaminase [Halovenus sp. WSH3]|uniref:cytidine deaminase n=1 Tax=Halovenus carboxidivorans TaxID=2692199 RepID=A0A6B0T732_9EURY|nr:cytidine deaminase [Halovenus carboxidivorans]MXR51383.1 cytidine deaminase [Halovenus carboxidivorans]